MQNSTGASATTAACKRWIMGPYLYECREGPRCEVPLERRPPPGALIVAGRVINTHFGGKSGRASRGWPGIIVALVFVLEELESAIQERAGTWTALGLSRRLLPIHPNHGKPVTGAEFESAVWLVEVTIWRSGEADLSTVRLTDDRVVNKHYELAGREDLDRLVDELVRLLADDELPPAAFVFQSPGAPS
jgi:hypothetical protein